MSSTLAEYKLEYEDMPAKTPKTVGRKKIMAKNTNTTESSTSKKKYAKTRGEHFKDMVIVALVVGIVAFGLGFKFNADRNAEMQNAVKAATTQAVAPEVKK